MASLFRLADGRKRIQFYDGNGKRRTQCSHAIAAAIHSAKETENDSIKSCQNSLCEQCQMIR